MSRGMNNQNKNSGRRPRRIQRLQSRPSPSLPTNSSPITGSGTIAQNTLGALTSCTTPRNALAFPDIYTSWFKTTIDSVFGTGVITSGNTYHLNSPAFQFGPQIDFTGAFANNYPSSMAYLLSSAVASGSGCPYNRSTVLEYDWNLDVINIAASSCYVTLLPSLFNSYSTMPTATLSEQRGAVQVLVPSKNILPIRMRQSGKIGDLFGTDAIESRDLYPFSQQVGGLPGFSCYMHVIVTSVDGTNVDCQVKSTVFLKIRYSGLNPSSSIAPL